MYPVPVRGVRSPACLFAGHGRSGREEVLAFSVILGDRSAAMKRSSLAPVHTTNVWKGEAWGRRTEA